MARPDLHRRVRAVGGGRSPTYHVVQIGIRIAPAVGAIEQKKGHEEAARYSERLGWHDSFSIVVYVIAVDLAHLGHMDGGDCLAPLTSYLGGDHSEEPMRGSSHRRCHSCLKSQLKSHEFSRIGC